jgi:hypothetical protein
MAAGVTASAYVASGFSRTIAGPRFLTIVGGDVADGSGGPLRRANVRIKDEKVIVNGAVVWDARKPTGERPGATLAPPRDLRR